MRRENLITSTGSYGWEQMETQMEATEFRSSNQNPSLKITKTFLMGVVLKPIVVSFCWEYSGRHRLYVVETHCAPYVKGGLSPRPPCWRNQKVFDFLVTLVLTIKGIWIKGYQRDVYNILNWKGCLQGGLRSRTWRVDSHFCPVEGSWCLRDHFIEISQEYVRSNPCT